jgi:Putative zinc-finger
MTCHELDARLDDWVDGSLPAPEALEVEAHLASCPACRESERRLRQVLAHAAALLRSQSPARDLWPEIAERLARERSWSWVGTPRGALALATAATVLLGMGALLWVQRAPTPARMVEIPVASPELVTATDGQPLSDPVLAAAEREYELAANALLEALQQRRPALRPETLEKIEGNLEVIDRALTEVRQALLKDPDNPELNRMLVATHRKKLDVLRRVVKLSTAL